MCVCVEESRRKQTIGALLWDYYLEELCDLKSTGALVYFLLLNHSCHLTYALKHRQDRQLYYNTVMSLYQKYC